jgi:Transposase DDE domain
MSILACDNAPRDATLSSVEAFLAETIPALLPDDAVPGGRGRPRILPSICLWSGMLVCVLHGFSAQLALWRLLAQRGLWHYPRVAISDQAVYTRLEQEGVRPLETLFAAISTRLATRLAPYAATDLAPFAREVVAIDESTLDKLARRLPPLRPLEAGDKRLLGGRLAGVFDLRRQQWRQVAYISDAAENEKRHARDLLQHLPTGSLILADLGYFGFQWFDDLTDGGYHWVSRLREKTSYREIHTFYRRGETFDGIIELGAYRADRAKHAVRLVQFHVGSTLYRYITNVRDPRTLSLKAIAQLYARRWDFELAVNTIKTHLNLHLLWSGKEVVIQQQVLAVLIIAQIVQAMRLEIAGRAGVDPFEVSLPLMIHYLPLFAAQGLDPIAAFLEHAREVRFIRPSSRTVIRAPNVPLHRIIPLPPDVVLLREPRYANRNCGPRTARTRN